MFVTATNLVRSIGNLPRRRTFNYVDPNNAKVIEVVSITHPEGPIKFKRYNPTKGQTSKDSKVEVIPSSHFIRIAEAIESETPFHVDTIFGGSGNKRSVIEALLAHTPQFYFCKLGRLELGQSNLPRKVSGHKHLIFRPNAPHKNGVMEEFDFKGTAVEIPSYTAAFDAIIGKDLKTVDEQTHAQIQVLLMEIGKHLGFRTWIAENDHGIELKGKKIIQHSCVVKRLSDEKILSAYADAVDSARLIDCVWFKNGRLMPAVMEVEHTTNITSGLIRMKRFFDAGPNLRDVRWVIVAPDGKREKVVKEANLPMFKDMDIKFFPYSSVLELHSLIKRRKPEGINDTFLNCFMEDCVSVGNQVRAELV